MKYAKKLRKGDKVAIVSLSSGMLGEAFCSHNIEIGVKRLREAAQILGVSRGYAYKIIRGLNNELKEKGYRVISGKVPTKYFEEKFYGMAVG